MEHECFSLKKTFKNFVQCLNELLALLSVCGDHKNEQQSKTSVEDLVPITFGRLNLTRRKPKPKNIRVLLDSSSSGTVMHETLAKRLVVKNH